MSEGQKDVALVTFKSIQDKTRREERGRDGDECSDVS